MEERDQSTNPLSTNNYILKIKIRD